MNFSNVMPGHTTADSIADNNSMYFGKPGISGIDAILFSNNIMDLVKGIELFVSLPLERIPSMGFHSESHAIRKIERINSKRKNFF